MGKLNLKLMQGIEKEEEQISDAHPDKSIKNAKETRKESGGKVMPSDSSPKASTSSKREESGKSGSKSKKEKGKSDKKDKQVFSFRAFIENINIWKAYALAAGITMEEFGSNAANEYMSRHKLSGPELAVFEALLKAREEKR